MLASSFLVCRLVVVCSHCSHQLVNVLPYPCIRYPCRDIGMGDASATLVVACCLPLKSVESQLLMWYAWSYGRILLSFCSLQTPY
ncbi:hypothetical protein FA15DRAFT_664722 [Coprinopsis marcescibilis]|uniref:Secreted protein n=1 Tax=Coprinopsis marcescibilis TaxID=230819 RepID=A0A5C3L8S6_COPMA|nr:hypothetical protein FA15DRAFT_664722 [Coprinopsis marcescibilis]